MASGQVLRAAAAALWWAQPQRRNSQAISDLSRTLTATERAEVAAVLEARTLSGLTDGELVDIMTCMAAKSVSEHKVAPADAKATTLAPTATDLGTFTGYVAVFGNRDLQGDVIARGALDATLAEFNAGRVVWPITSSHSESPDDVVAHVVAALVDSHGLKVEAAWHPGERAQQLRQAVMAGGKFGLSIDYLPTRYRPDGQGGRLLEKVTLLGAAITPHPANPEAQIIAGKGAAITPVVDVYADVQTRRRDPDDDRRRRMAATIAAAEWPPASLVASLGVERAYDLLEGATAAKACRDVASVADRRQISTAEQRYRADTDRAFVARTARRGCGYCPGCKGGRPDWCTSI